MQAISRMKAAMKPSIRTKLISPPESFPFSKLEWSRHFAHGMKEYFRIDLRIIGMDDHPHAFVRHLFRHTGVQQHVSLGIIYLPVMDIPVNFAHIRPRKQVFEGEPRIGWKILHDRRHHEIGGAIDFDGTADGVFVAKELLRQLFGEDHAAWPFERGRRIAFKQGKAKQLEKARIRRAALCLDMSIAHGEDKGAYPAHADGGIYFVVIGRRDHRGENRRGGAIHTYVTIVGVAGEDLVDAVTVLVELVAGELVADPEKQYDGAGQADGKAGDIDRGEAFVAVERAAGDLEIVQEKLEGGTEGGSRRRRWAGR